MKILPSKVNVPGRVTVSREPKMPALKVRGVNKSYVNAARGELCPILANVSLDVNSGEICALLGPSGCGKSTLLRIIVGTESEDSGTIVVEPSDNSRELGIVFQSNNCLPWLRARENVEFGIVNGKFPREQRRYMAEEALKRVELEGHAESYPESMSGGEQQRVAFARLLASRKSIWLLDEPFSALDAKTRGRMRGLLKEKTQADRVAALLVTHDLVEAVDLANTIYVLSSVPSSVSCMLDRLVELREDGKLVLQAHQFLSKIIGARNPPAPLGELASYVKTWSC
jgi:NitT/TauT family transport system ATP-binding protein